MRTAFSAIVLTTLILLHTSRLAMAQDDVGALVPMAIPMQQPQFEADPILQPLPQPAPQEKSALLPETLYVLHGGMADPNNDSTEDIHQYLLSRGIPEAQVVVLANPYPAIAPNLKDVGQLLDTIEKNGFGRFLKTTARQTKANMLINWDIFKDSSNLTSPVTMEAYHQLMVALKEKQAAFGNRPIRIVWIGLSAGGQMGLTLTEKLASESPALNGAFEVETIVTLGSPILRNQVPARVRIVTCISNEDEVLSQTTRPGAAKLFIGQDVTKIPPNQDANDEVREFTLPVQREFDVTEGHNMWHRDREVLAKALQGVIP